MSGSLNKNIVKIFKTRFEAQCLNLLIHSYTTAITSGTNFKELDENSITAQLIGYMKKNPISTDYKIDITREHYLDNEETYSGQTDPDTSPRIDIRFMNWETSDKFEYFIEAKNLYETNLKKSGRTTPVNATKYNKRYIETGIQNFIDGKYPRGCLVGYVLVGEPDNVASNINAILLTANRKGEKLIKGGSILTKYYFTSKHSTILELKHFLLKFS